MSRINGDKAKFHGKRKRQIARRLKQKQLYKDLTATTAASGAKTKPVAQ